MKKLLQFKICLQYIFLLSSLSEKLFFPRKFWKITSFRRLYNRLKKKESKNWNVSFPFNYSDLFAQSSMQCFYVSLGAQTFPQMQTALNDLENVREKNIYFVRNLEGKKKKVFKQRKIHREHFHSEFWSVQIIVPRLENCKDFRILALSAVLNSLFVLFLNCSLRLSKDFKRSRRNYEHLLQFSLIEKM